MRVEKHFTDIGSLVQSPEIEEGQWLPTKGEILQTKDVRSSIVIAAHNPLSGTGFLGHFSLDYRMSIEPPFSEIVEAIKNNDSKVPYEAWISGAASLEGGYDKTVLNEYYKMNELGRLTTVRALGRAGVRPIREDWLGENERISAVIFDPSAGVLQYSIANF